jgi:hypothetical protein
MRDTLFDNGSKGKQPRGGAIRDISNPNVIHMELMGFWHKYERRLLCILSRGRTVEFQRQCRSRVVSLPQILQSLCRVRKYRIYNGTFC